MELMNTGVLMILGIGVFGGIIGAHLFQRLHIPQVVGYIMMGLLIGDIGFGLVDQEAIEGLESLNLFALGIIGFLVGGELHLDIFKNQGKQLFAILLCEGILASLLVGIPVTGIMYFLTDNFSVALASGIVFGAIASATDPASTLNVLWEYRSRGILTTTLIAIVALDDALAMTLYGLGTTAARILTGNSASFTKELLGTFMELGGAVVMGVLAGFALRTMSRWIGSPEKLFTGAIGLILLIIGIASALEMDVILAAMSLGVTLVNSTPERSKQVFATVRSFADPIYVIFFVLVGARLNISAMPPWLWGIVFVYVLGRSSGKIVGAYVGARMTGAPPAVQKFTGMGLFAQGGIAVGLSIMAAHHLGDVRVNESLSLGDMIIFGVTASTFVLQITGPPLIKLASKLAGEIGRDVAEEDVIETWMVNEAMKTSVPPITQGTPLTHVFQIFSMHDYTMYPVVGGEDELKGVLSLEGMKGIMISPDTWDWVLAADVMSEVNGTVTADMRLDKALESMRDNGVEEVPVVDGSNKIIGMLDQRTIRIRVNEEVIRRRESTDATS
ncbi:MAG TPA: CBS domain-containing protein [Candidatus Hydrogenedentes bacterium]|nr:CBS domain-containing protein [Candidatus Hydrogenedentota bacterium]